MGHEIVYCVQCSTRLTGADFEKGKAFRAGHRIFCAPCASKTLTPAEIHPAPAPDPLKPPSTSRRIPAVPPREVGSSANYRAIPAPPAPSRTPLMLGLAGAAALIAGIAVLLLRPSPPPPEPPENPRTVKPPETRPKEDEATVAARKAVGEAILLVQSRPDDFDAQQAAWEAALRKAEPTPLHGEAAAGLRGVRERREAASARERVQLDAELAPLLEAQRFQAALDACAKARTRRPAPEWAARIDEKTRTVQQALEIRVAEMKERLSDARRRGATPDVKKLLDQVREWGVASAVARLEAHAGLDLVPPPPVSAELKAYRVRWEGAMAMATARQFDAAVAEVQKAARDIGSDPVKKESEADAEDLRALPALMREGREALSQSVAGTSLALHYRNEAGERVAATGTVLKAGPVRLELRGGDLLFVELSEVAAASLAAALGGRPEPDRRRLAILCLLEGDREAADQLVGSASGRLDERYWEYARGAAARIPPTPPPEAQARRLFYAAEREVRKMETIGSAVTKYRELLSGYASTSLVKGELTHLQKRAESGREYFLTAELKGQGTFAIANHPRVERAWTSRQDSEQDQAVENFVEAEFFALPEAMYRAWLYVGGCCAENFAFLYQATDATDLHPRTRQKIGLDPGGGFAMPVKHSISGLRKTHALHATKKEPKAPVRWEWISLPLPKYPAAGLKKIRLLTDQQGFAVAAVFVSATRSSPPADAELKEQLARAPKTGVEEGLVAWWRLDEGAGASVADDLDSGHSGALKGAVAWVTGKRGGAIRFTGGTDVTIKGEVRVKTLTIAAWVKHDEFNGKVQRYVTMGGDVAVLRHENRSKALHFYCHINGQLRHVVADNVLETGKWFHAAGTWDGATLRLYKDGVEVGSLPQAGTLDGIVDFIVFGSSTEMLRGALDDVRIYRRALGPEEVKRLSGDETLAPEIASGKPWKPIFDGKTHDWLNPQSHHGWKVENGVLELIPGQDSAAQSREDFGDGEIRIRFDCSSLGNLYFTVRQGGNGVYSAHIDGPSLPSLDGKTHEILFVCNGSAVTATLDGKPTHVENTGSPKTGRIQFNAKGKSFRILAIEYRELP